MENTNETWLTAKKEEYRNGYQLQHNRIPGVRAQYAMEIAKHIGIALATPDGEDSSGRQKLRQLTPGEVAHRACEISEAIFSHFDDRGWILDLPKGEEPPAGSP